MTNEQQNLMKELGQAIEANGFTFLRFMNCETIAVYCLANKVDHTIEIVETYRNNGTSENKSCYIEVVKWYKMGGGSIIERIKINQKDGQKKRQNAINKIVNAYYNSITK